ncbi:unnamed protein product [Rotaria socialis]|uniref:Uncharacterized protein n=1 Tax=Rotaria socialis TaxID=392032 RepID=A0A817TN60_9BILA|nr:unnamed protein product [Rotaria socialis]CAF3318490.1 unnamed protein product [Rotaria socialis]CAF4307678.1 unnamed protein product [Rotaria socialis]CAF4476026.1 unnamed protein product [Rotaria socialis]
MHIFWLDATINTSSHSITVQSKVRSIISHLQAFDDIDKCERIIRSLPTGEQLILIVSGSFGREIVPRIHDLPQISAVYIYCMNSKINKKWSDPFDKVKLVTANIDKIFAQLRLRQRRRLLHDEPISFSISDRSIGAIDGKFLHFQLIDILIGIASSNTGIDEFLSHMQSKYQKDTNQQSILQEFKSDYRPDRALW